jgi:hypothetical protein
MDESTDRLMDRRKYGRVEGRNDRWTDRQTGQVAKQADRKAY